MDVFICIRYICTIVFYLLERLGEIEVFWRCPLLTLWVHTDLLAARFHGIRTSMKHWSCERQMNAGLDRVRLETVIRAGGQTVWPTAWPSL